MTRRAVDRTEPIVDPVHLPSSLTTRADAAISMPRVDPGSMTSAHARVVHHESARG
jgi:hypothetical protein